MLLSQNKGARNDVEEAPVRSFTPAGQMRAALAALLFDDPAHLDIRHLWTRGRTNFFRVNWWITESTGVRRVTRSRFIPLEEVGGGWRIRGSDGGRGGAPPMVQKERQAA
jgi:hypothetical protein